MRLDAYLGAQGRAAEYSMRIGTPDDLKVRLKNDLRKILAPRLAAAPIVGAYQDVVPAAVGDEKLARAEASLATMPLDVVPAPAALPAGSRMPLARNALFVGREEDLKALAGALKAGRDGSDRPGRDGDRAWRHRQDPARERVRPPLRPVFRWRRLLAEFRRSGVGAGRDRDLRRAGD